jgi:hypothetical protein
MGETSNSKHETQHHEVHKPRGVPTQHHLQPACVLGRVPPVVVSLLLEVHLPLSSCIRNQLRIKQIDKRSF